jgi:hypothetical protein
MSSAQHHWEGVDGNMSRIRIPGGWIYRLEHSGAAVFVPLDAVQKDLAWSDQVARDAEAKRGVP